MLDTPEVNKRIAEIEGKVFTRFNDPVENRYYGDYVFVETKAYCMTDGEFDSEDVYRPCPYRLMVKHNIERVYDPVIGWCYRSTQGTKTLMPVKIYGEEKAICLAILDGHNKLN